MTGYNKQYRLSYRLYKKALNLIICSLEFQDSNNINLAKGMPFRTLNKYMLNRHNFVDGHYALELLRIQYFGPTPEGHRLPQFSKEENDQITGYFTEHYTLLIFSNYLTILDSQKNNQMIPETNELNFLPMSQIINKDPSKLFNLPISKKTFFSNNENLTNVSEIYYKKYARIVQ